MDNGPPGYRGGSSAAAPLRKPCGSQTSAPLPHPKGRIRSARNCLRPGRPPCSSFRHWQRRRPSEMERSTHGPAGRTHRSRRLHSAVLATRSDHRHSASLAHQRRSRPLRPGARATVPATRSRFRHQRRSRTRARIAPAAVAFSHQVLLPPAVAIRDLSLRPAEPHLQRLGRQATLPPPAHLGHFGTGAVPLSPSKRLHAREWPCQFSPPGSSHSSRWAGEEGGRTLDQLSRSVRFRYRASDREAAESAGSASRLSPAVRRCPGERGRPEHGSLGQSETPRPVTAGSSAHVYSSTPCCQFGSRTVWRHRAATPHRGSEHGRQNRVAGRFRARRWYRAVHRGRATPHRAAYRAAAHGGRGEGALGPLTVKFKPDTLGERRPARTSNSVRRATDIRCTLRV